MKCQARLASRVCCTKCKGWFGGLDYSRHKKKCNNRVSRNRQVVKQASTEFKRTIELQPTSSRVEVLVFNFSQDLSEGEVTATIKEDPCLQLLTKHYATLHNNSTMEGNNARQNLRTLAKIRLQIRETNPSLTSYEQCLTPSKYDILIEASLKSFKSKPTVILSLNSTIKHLVSAYKNYCIRANTTEKKQVLLQLEAFLSIHETEYRELASKEARNEVLTRQLSKVNFLLESL